MRQFFTRFRYFVATFLFLVTTSLSTGGAVFAAASNPIQWTGQGTTNGALDTVQCKDDTAQAGSLLWIFTATGADSATITINGQSFAMSQPNGNSGAFKYVQTGFNGDFSSLVASATYEGSINGNGTPQLTISHGCPPTPTQVPTQAPVVKTDPCGTANDVFTVPVVTGVVYKVGTTVVSGDVHTGGALTVTVNAYPASSAYTLTGTTSWTLTFTNETCTTTVTTQAPVVKTDDCGTANDMFTVPIVTGVVYKVNGNVVSGDVATGGALSVTVNAYPASSDYTLTGTTSWTLTFTDEACETPPTPVTPAVMHTTPNCEMHTMTVTPTVMAGVIWSPSSSPTTLQPGQSVTYTASADTANNYVLAQGATTSFPFTNDFNPASCPCGCDHTVTPGTVTFHEVCGYENDTYTIPATAHVNYYVNGSVIPASAGVHHVTAGQTITVTAEGTDGYTVTGTHSWSHEFTNEPCVIKVYPPKVEFKDLCETKNDTFTIPSKTGVEYRVNGSPIAAGTYKASDYAVNGTVTVTAVAKDGYKLKGDMHTWMHTYTNVACEGGGGGEIPATPAVATFADVCETANDTYTVPATTGVTYKVNGVVTAAGSYNGTGTVTITAEAMPSYVLNGPASWSHTFTNESCGQVLGEETVVFTPAPAGHGAEAPAELANTGQNSFASVLAAFLVLTSAVFVYAFVPKRQIS